MEWGVFRLKLDKQCQEALKRIEYCPGKEGDSVLIKCVVVKSNVFVPKTAADLYGTSVDSPPAKTV